MTKHTLKDIISLAINNEIEAYQFYHEASKKITSDKNLADTFEEFAVEEQKHRKLLQELLEGNIQEINLPELNDYHVSEGVEKPKLTTDMKFVDAVGLAMKNEEEAMIMYQKFAEMSTNNNQKELFLKLSKMEEMHKVTLEKIYVNAAYVEVW